MTFILGLATLIVAACVPYGDGKSAGGIPSDVNDSRLVGTWVSASGETMIIAADNTLATNTCNTQARVTSVFRGRTCATEVDSCGSIGLTVDSSTDSTDCIPTGKIICLFASRSDDVINGTRISCRTSLGASLYFTQQNTK